MSLSGFACGSTSESSWIHFSLERFFPIHQVVIHVSGCVSLALLNDGLVAFWELLYYPSSDVLGGRVEGEKLVEVAMVEITMNLLLDEREVDDHPVLVQLFCLAEDLDDPVVPMQLAALARIGEVEVVAGRNLYSF